MIVSWMDGGMRIEPETEEETMLLDVLVRAAVRPTGPRRPAQAAQIQTTPLLSTDRLTPPDGAGSHTPNLKSRRLAIHRPQT